jgi:hypothetical protein
MIAASTALSSIPSGLREPLLKEYRTIVQNFLEQRWLPSELHGGRLSEIAYTILDGQAKKSYAPAPAKPSKFVDACRKLENNKLPHVPHSFQITIPRLLPALYDVRNNRNVGHVGGDVDPNHMDAVAVLSMSNWIMGELVRVFHSLSTTAQAQQLVDALVEVRLPAVWTGDNGVKRVLERGLKLHEEILLLAAVTMPDVTSKQLIEWIEYGNDKYVMRTIRNLHKQRQVEYTENTDKIHILPPGTKAVQKLISKKNLTGII